ncbi:hypothetical protein EJB05_20532, partial [Eragrostis curvula]
ETGARVNPVPPRVRRGSPGHCIFRAPGFTRSCTSRLLYALDATRYRHTNAFDTALSLSHFVGSRAPADVFIRRPVANCRKSRAAASGRRSVAAAPSARLAKACVIRSEAVSGRGQHVAPANAVADAAPITATKWWIVPLSVVAFLVSLF